MARIALALGNGAHHALHQATAPRIPAVSGSGAANDLSQRIGEHSYWCPGKGWCIPKPGFVGGEFNVDTIGMTLIVMVIMLGLALFVRSRLTAGAPRGVQNTLEMILEFIDAQVMDTLGSKRGATIGPLAIALFLFLLISNCIGVVAVPYRWWHAPTSDINTTLGLALMVFFLVHTMSIRARGGGGFVKHFFQPYWWLFPINIIEELSKPVTLAFRLFGNIFADEVLIIVLGALLSNGVLYAALPFGHAILGVGLGLFVAAVQAFIFTVLTISYIGIATATEGH